MKRLLAYLLAIGLVLSLCAACGSSEAKETGSTQPATTVPAVQEDQPTTPVQTPPTQPQDTALLSAPTKVLSTDGLKILFDYEDVNGNTLKGSLVMVDNASPALLYFESNNERYVYELADDGTITLYTAIDTWDFTMDTSTSQEDLKNATNTLLEMISYAGRDFTIQNPNISYRPIEEPSILDTIFVDNDSNWYELVSDGTMVGYVAVDGQTGIFEYLATNSFRFIISSADITDVHYWIPQYK